MKRFNLHIKFGLILIILNVSALLLWWWIYNHAVSAQESIYTSRTGLDEISTRVENIKHLESVLSDVDLERQLVSSSFIDSKSIVHFIERMEEIATTTSVRLEVNAAALPATTKDIGPLFRLSIKGNFSNIHRFMDLLMNTEYQVFMERFALDQQFDSEKRPVGWMADVEVRVLSYLFAR